MLKEIIFILLGYIIGSIPWGLIIGKVFFHKDIRNYGSGNLGGTNAGRVLGAPIGILVIVLDAMKAFLMMLASHSFITDVMTLQLIGLAVCIGHCFPLFANFKGGKAVACSYGYLLGLSVFVTNEYLYTFALPLLIFLIILVISKMVSLSSMIGVTSSTILQFIFGEVSIAIPLLLLATFVIYRHKANIQRIISGTESKIGHKK